MAAKSRYVCPRRTRNTGSEIGKYREINKDGKRKSTD